MPHTHRTRYATAYWFSVGVFLVALASIARGEEPAPPPGDGNGSSASENSGLRSEVEQLKLLVQQQQARISALVGYLRSIQEK